jgi:glutamate synthase domain-containing protein 3
MDPATPAVVPVNEIRDYHRINAEVAHALDRGAKLVRLTGVEGQRLLLAGLRGPWRATVEVSGDAGPELAAGLDAPGLLTIVRGSVADGAARSLVAGDILILGVAGDATSNRQAGGTVCCAGRAGNRSGLAMGGGLLLLRGGTGRLAGDRQEGGLIAVQGDLGPFEGRGRRGGRLVRPAEPCDAATTALIRDATRRFQPWLDPVPGRG